MKIALVSLMVVLSATTALPNEEVIQMRKRFAELEIERLDFRKPKPELSKDKEKERQTVIGWLYVNDGLWRLKEEVISQINALASSKIDADRRDVELSKRHKALAIVSELMSNADTELTEQELGQLRALIAIGDRERLIAWHETKRSK